MSDPVTRLTTSHWGAFHVTAEQGRIVDTAPFEGDPSPPDIAASIPSAVHHPSRVDQPYVRKGWLNKTAGSLRGEDEFIPLPWDEALDIAAAELTRVCRDHGNGSIFGGSYGWASAGRFHHAQSQVHRFLNTIGGYVSSYASYSTAAGQAIIPHVLGLNFHKMTWGGTNAWSLIQDHTDTLVMFGGVNPKNAQVSMGGVTEHQTAGHFERFAASGKRMISISPQRCDSPDVTDWMPIEPGTDVALMLALAFVLDTEGLADQDFLSTHCTGYPQFKSYVLGETDGLPKTPDWAAAICRIDAEEITSLARTMASGRTLIAMSWSLQRARHGEQPYWMAVVLAAMLGQIGLPGGGVGFGYGAIGNVGASLRRMQGPLFAQGTNPISDFIPVSRIADMLLGAGQPYDFNGQSRVYPDIKLVYWCGGNPFHHHQDLNRLARAWQTPDTVIVHEPWWTATAKRADIVFPATTQFEREDIGWAKGDPYLFHMPQMIPPVDQARDDYDIFAGLAARMGVAAAFTEGRSSSEWVETLYASFERSSKQAGIDVPDFKTLKTKNMVRLPLDLPGPPEAPFAAFRADPEGAPLGTPSGKIEIFSPTIDGFGYAEVPGHPVWIAPEVSADFPLRLVSPQPGDKLHSQLQSAIADQAEGGPLTDVEMHPEDAAHRGLTHGDPVCVWNDKGVCLARLRVTPGLLQGVVAMATGAWFQPDANGVDLSGNPNTLTSDSGTSALGQGSAAHNVGVEIAAFDGHSD